VLDLPCGATLRWSRTRLYGQHAMILATLRMCRIERIGLPDADPGLSDAGLSKSGDAKLEMRKLETRNAKARNSKCESWKLEMRKLETRNAKTGNSKCENWKLEMRKLGKRENKSENWGTQPGKPWGTTTHRAYVSALWCYPTTWTTQLRASLTQPRPAT
jgi:hypothetical protein